MKILYIEDRSDIEELLKSFTSTDLDQDRNAPVVSPIVDYVVSPIDIWKSLLTTSFDNILNPSSYSDFLHFGLLRINKFANEVYYLDKKIFLSRREYDLLNLIVSNSPRITTLDNIRISIWKEYGHLMSNTVEVHINRINKKLGRKIIKCVKGFGYKLSNG
jgi:DNA-binding response OmpR family regulator